MVCMCLHAYVWLGQYDILTSTVRTVHVTYIVLSHINKYNRIE